MSPQVEFAPSLRLQLSSRPEGGEPVGWGGGPVRSSFKLQSVLITDNPLSLSPEAQALSVHEEALQQRTDV